MGYKVTWEIDFQDEVNSPEEAAKLALDYIVNGTARVFNVETLDTGGKRMVVPTVTIDVDALEEEECEEDTSELATLITKQRQLNRALVILGQEVDVVDHLPIHEGYGRDEFMAFFRSDAYTELSADDCFEVWSESIKGSADITKKNVEEWAANYNVDIHQILNPPYMMKVRQDLLDEGLSVEVGGDYYGESDPLPVRWEDSDFQVFYNGEWVDACSIDWEDVV